MSQRKVRVRFAPSPTGALHIGGVRTALYNYLFARRNGGDFLLRIEDTDSGRFVPGAEDYIIESLKWCGIKVDEGVSVGGPHAPYRQSERKELYLKYALELVEKGWAYYAFDSAEELENIRKEHEAAGKTFAYNSTVRTELPTSLSLSAEETARRISERNDWVVRFKMPEDEDVQMDDIVRGHVTINTSTLDDKVLYKAADQLPTYHLANIVDDHLMEITHVIRGEEWLPSLPLHILLYRAFGWEETRPQFAHLPLLLKPDGGGKLSKRDGDRLGFPVFPLLWKSPAGDISRGYREDGYLPEAFVNMLALMGWNPGDDREIMSMDELIESFSLEHVSKAGARFNPEKARWFNAQYIKKCGDEKLADILEAQLHTHGIASTREKTVKVCSLIKERAVLLTELYDLSDFFFTAPESYDEKVVKKFWKNGNPAAVKEIATLIEKAPGTDAAAMETLLHGYIETNGLPMGQVMNSLRLALVGQSKGPGINDIIETLGREETVRRLEKAVQTLGIPQPEQ